VSFIIINALSIKYKFFAGMEREGEKASLGTVYYAAAITVLMAISLVFEETLIPSGIAVFALSFGDGFAAIAGHYLGKNSPRITKNKSLVGSVACFVFAIAGVYILSLFVPIELSFAQVAIIGAATAVLELAGWGLDNFTISFGIVALATLFREKWIF
jgi:dolichol kinase